MYLVENKDTKDIIKENFKTYDEALEYILSISWDIKWNGENYYHPCGIIYEIKEY